MVGDVYGKVGAILLKWFKKHKRAFPWRRTSNPYKILMAESMLQRTKANQVVPVYLLFIKKFPNLTTLSDATYEEIEKFFLKLGLMWRARKVKKLADELAPRYKGRIPASRKKLLTLPGVGEYVADAVLASAYGEEVAAVDVNVCRVIGRLFAVKAHGEARRDPEFRRIAQRMVPEGKAKEFNWAMIDFAALVCTPRNPKCVTCPVKNMCLHAKAIK